MEELFVYALLYSEGFDVWPLYADKLDRLFMEDMENEAYLTLEGMAPKEAVLHTLSIIVATHLSCPKINQIDCHRMSRYNGISLKKGKVPGHLQFRHR